MITIYGGSGDVLSPLAALLFVFGVLSLTMGLMHLLMPRRAVTEPPDWWGRLDDPVPEPSPAPVLAGVGGGVSAPPPPAPLSTFDSGAGPTDPSPRSPQNPGPAVAYAAIVLEPAGKWGNYWQEVGRCSHRHGTEGAAWDCAQAEPVAGSSGRILAVGLAE
jgi:hypothetical protein